MDDRQTKRPKGRPGRPGMSVKLTDRDGHVLEFESQTKAAEYLKVSCQRIWLSLKAGIKVRGFAVQAGA